ncbi:MAG: 5-formyltetrahydrofolate cyclo-ligase [Raineya sp.]|jgi:5-formyltetrahydrofolate cyclo-ligase|nr:5-formyltetrahydrofolate cyclo-ligase [Raineya sp.]
MLKADIRKIYKEKRLSLSTACFEERNNKLLHFFISWGKLKELQFIHTFLPILSQKEPNTWAFIHQSWEDQSKISWIIATTNFKTKELSHFYLDKHTKLNHNKWGISEPINAKPCPIKNIQMVLVPLLAFDERGFRVGYGQGFYDRFLAQCPQTIKVGISLEPSLEENITDTDPYDVPLDYCISPEGIIDFSKQF